MAIIKELNGDRPVIGERAFLAETATIIGTVTMGDDCSVWYGAVLRGDVGAIRTFLHRQICRRTLFLR